MLKRLPAGLTLALIVLALAHGPVAQLPDYHAFADQSHWLGLPHAGDLLSNLGFVLLGVWGGRVAWPQAGTPGASGQRLFIVALFATGWGSAFYHWAPDDFRLIWDRLPIALACAGLLAAVRASCLVRESLLWTVGLASFAIAGVGGWVVSGDLRAYLLLQVLPLLLIPLWQAGARRPRRERLAFALALAVYVLAKLAELGDHALAAQLAPLTGHTLKHLLAALAAALILNEWRQQRRG
ncbi:MAG: hypothetical protein RIR00_894 [Pseudomonadota bacterium]